MKEKVNLRAKIYEHGVLYRYEAVGVVSREVCYLSIDEIKALACEGFIEGVGLDCKYNKLYGTTIDLRKLKRINKEFARNIVKTMTNVLVGIELKEFVDKGIEDYKERYVVNDILDFCNSTDTKENHKICMVYGLRKTGKTIVMLHTINRLKDYSRSMYVALNNTVSVPDLFQVLNKILEQGIKYVFLDEISEIDGIMDSCTQLSDLYAKMGLKVVISCDNSLLLEMMSWNKLYDSCIKVGTTYISYKEYDSLFNGADIMNYIRIGGTLVKDTFCDEMHTREYINSSILNNIKHSLIRSKNKYDYQNLLELDFRGLFKEAIEKSITLLSGELASKIIADNYKNGRLEHVKQLLEKQFYIDDTFNTYELKELIKYYLGILRDYDEKITEDCLLDLKDFFEMIDIIKIYKRYIENESQITEVEASVFVQSGLVYNQCASMFRYLLNSDDYESLSYNERETFKSKLIEDLESNILKQIVLIALLEKYKNDKDLIVAHFRCKDMEGIVVKDKWFIDLYEVNNQCEQLVNGEFCERVMQSLGGTIRNHYVLYLREGKNIKDNGYTIRYGNVSDFLKAL